LKVQKGGCFPRKTEILFWHCLSLGMGKLVFDADALASKLQQVRAKAVTLSVLRLFAFIGLVAFSILGVAEHGLWLLPAVALLGGFIYLIQQFTAAKDQERVYLALEQLALRRTARQTRQLAPLAPGLEFADKSHPFSGDLDLFGPHSLFQLLNHSTSPGGTRELAALMTAPFSPVDAQERRAAAAELQGKPDFLRAMEAVGMAFEQKDGGSWRQWLAQEEKVSYWHRLVALLGPLGGVGMLLATGLGILPQALLGVWFLLGMALLSRVFVPLKQAADAIPVASHLKSLRLRAGLITESTFDAPLLQREQGCLQAAGASAVQQLEDLDRLGLWAQNRLNMLYFPINLLFWTDYLLYIRLANWKRRVSKSLQQLPETMERWEVWVSLGSFELEVGHPGTAEWTDSPLIAAENVAHPLLHPEKAVANSLSLDDNHRLVLLTGANMSGKTTFMRTLGINAVLVNLGLRPFADRFVLGPIQLFTSMRNTDNLGESVSSFYAELFRIRTLIQRLEEGETLFFLLDEILKGTNTQDRISGSEALVAQLLPTKGLGLISTHDIELSALGDREPRVDNYSFHSEIQDQEILFDYRLKEGACPSFNAHKLMELMGIKFAPKE
jgi:hypothetical protein